MYFQSEEIIAPLALPDTQFYYYISPASNLTYFTPISLQFPETPNSTNKSITNCTSQEKAEKQEQALWSETVEFSEEQETPRPKNKKVKKKKKISSIRSQKADRNMASNMLKFLNNCFYHLTNKLQVVERIRKKLKLQMAASEFWRIYHKKVKHRQTYIRLSQIKKLCMKESSEFSLILRVLINQFLREQVRPAILHSRKILNKLKPKELKYCRVLRQLIFDKN